MKKLMVCLVVVLAMSGLAFSPLHAQEAAGSAKSEVEAKSGEHHQHHHAGKKMEHGKKKSCYKEAKAKKLKDQERKDYIHQCMAS